MLRRFAKETTAPGFRYGITDPGAATLIWGKERSKAIEQNVHGRQADLRLSPDPT